MRHIAFAALPAALVFAFTACSDRPSIAEPAAGVPSIRMAQGKPADVDETPFTVTNCGFPIEVVLSGKGKMITLPGGRTILTSPGLTATLTNLGNNNRRTIVITGSFHHRILKNGNIEIVASGRNVLLDPQVPGLPGLVLAVGHYTWVLDGQGNLVQPLEGTGQMIDLCALLA